MNYQFQPDDPEPRERRPKKEKEVKYVVPDHEVPLYKILNQAATWGVIFVMAPFMFIWHRRWELLITYMVLFGIPVVCCIISQIRAENAYAKSKKEYEDWKTSYEEHVAAPVVEEQPIISNPMKRGDPIPCGRLDTALIAERLRLSAQRHTRH